MTQFLSCSVINLVKAYDINSARNAQASLRAKADSVPQPSFARVTKRAAVIGAPASDGRLRRSVKICLLTPNSFVDAAAVLRTTPGWPQRELPPDPSSAFHVVL